MFLKIKSTISDLKEGEFLENTIEITESCIQKFIALTGDSAPVHINDEYARSMGYSSRVAHGLLIASMFSRMLGMYLPGPNTILHQITTQMREPTFIGDLLLYRVTVFRIIPAIKAVLLTLSVVNQLGTLVNTGEATCIFRF